MAAPPLLSLQDIHLGFGGPPLLAGAEMYVHERDRIGLVGRNGSGKSTLMKIAAGLVQADEGVRFVQPGITLRYLEQAPDFSRFPTALAAVEDGLAEGDLKYRAEYLLEQLGLTGRESPANLSGGEARRVALARALAPDPDVLLLDEPTNHLDLPTIAWLEDELRRSRAALVLISHDRRFLEHLTRRMIWLDRGTSRTLGESFASFEGWRDRVLDQEAVEQQKLQKQIEAEEHWLRHGVSGRRKRNQKRLAGLQSLRTDRIQRRARQLKDYRLNVGEGEVSSHRVLLARNLGKSFGDKVIVSGFETIIMRGDRVGLVGPNGAGKTTLLKLLTGELAPDAGTVKLGAALEVISLDQQRNLLDPRLSIYETLTKDQGEMLQIGDDTRHVYGYMRDFLFPPKMARTPVSALSGGERGRLALAVAMCRRSNLLVLDEPTNDLDLETLDLLEEMLAEYQGTVLLVSHDRDFLDRAVSSVIAPDPVARLRGRPGIWVEYAGGYSDMLEQQRKALASAGFDPDRVVEPLGGADTAAPASVKSPRQQVQTPAVQSGARPDTKPGANKARLSFKDKYALETLPGEIDRLDTEIAAIEAAMADPAFYTRDPDGFGRKATRLEAARAEREAAEERWLELELQREEIEAQG